VWLSPSRRHRVSRRVVRHRGVVGREVSGDRVDLEVRVGLVGLAVGLVDRVGLVR
jgi:hypothetical protein